MCHFLNLHNNHKLLRINDEEALKKENISLEESKKDFIDNKNNIEELKNKIEKEIIEIDKSYEKASNEVTKSYGSKHEQLIKEENELKDKLKNEVTKIKEKLEINLSKINNTIRNLERIMKSFKIFKEEENQMIKKLNYISYLNKSQKEMKIIFQLLMKNLNISFKDTNIIYEEYYFNGLPIPTNIKFDNIFSDSFKILWNIGNIKNANIDNRQIKYIIEMRKENDKFISVYKGNDNNYIIKNLDENTNYEIRICSIYNDIKSDWTELYKIKTKLGDSII